MIQFGKKIMYVSSERDYKIPEKLRFVEGINEEKQAEKRDKLQVHIHPSRNELKSACSTLEF